MKKNMGTTDRIVRFVIAAVIIGLYFGGIINGLLAVKFNTIGQAGLRKCLASPKEKERQQKYRVVHRL